MVTHARPSALAWDFWVAIVFMAIVAVLAIWRLSQPTAPMAALPLLGTIEPDRPAPTPTPTPEPRRR